MSRRPDPKRRARGSAPNRGRTTERPAQAQAQRPRANAKAEPTPRRDDPGAVRPNPGTVPPARVWFIDLAILLGGLAGATLLAELFGAANLGTALTFGQLGFAIALMYVLLRR